MIFDYVYPRDGKYTDPQMVFSSNNLANFSHSDTFYGEGMNDEAPSALSPDDIELLRGLFSVRTGGGVPLVRGHALWESMLWEPCEPMDPRELLDTTDNSFHLGREWTPERKAAQSSRYWGKKGGPKRDRRPKWRAGDGAGHKASESSRRTHQRIMESVFRKESAE